MSNKIEVGEYVRTQEGYILENTVKAHMNIIEKLVEKNREYKNKFGRIVKHSKNITDLIEVDDIVKVLDIDMIKMFKLDNQEEIEMFKEELQEKDYKLLSIVTKEQFAQVEYKVESET